MYSYFVMAEPSNVSIEIKRIPKQIRDYFLGCFDENETITLKQFGEAHDRIKFYSYFTIESVNRWKDLLKEFQIQATEQGHNMIRLHYLYEEYIMFFIQSAKIDGEIDIKIYNGLEGDSKYFLCEYFAQKLIKHEPSLKLKFFGRNLSRSEDSEPEDFEEEEDSETEVFQEMYVYLPLYKKTIEESSRPDGYSRFKRLDFKNLQRDPIYLLMQGNF